MAKQNSMANEAFSLNVDTTATINTLHLTNALEVQYGGTGAATLTTHGILLGQGVGAVTALTPVGTTANQVLVSGGAGANPAWSTATFPVATTQGDILYASADNTVASLAKNVTATRYLANTGVNNGPQWDQVSLTTGVTGTLPVTSGGIGAATLTANRLLLGNGASAIAAAAAGSAGQVLTSTGATAPGWTTATYPSTVAAKGSVICSTGADAFGVTAVGAANTYLKADGAGGLSWALPPGALTIRKITSYPAVGTPTTLITNSLYILDAAANGTGYFKLPTSANSAVGDIIKMVVSDSTHASAFFSIGVQTAQKILFASQSTTTSITSAGPRTAVELVCTYNTGGTTEWCVVSAVGSATKLT